MRALRPVPLIAICLTLLVTPSHAAGPPPAVDIQTLVRIPMRDKVELGAVVFRPHGVTEKLPAIVTISPYLSDRSQKRGMFFARNGYVYVSVDSRGRGESGGSFEPFVGDGVDGHDVIEWVAAQPWCNGKVGMFGGSYTGFNQWATAAQRPPHLATIVPSVAVFPGVDYPNARGMWERYPARWLSLVSRGTMRWEMFSDSEHWRSLYVRAYGEHVSQEAFDDWAGVPSRFHDEWLAHPTEDAYWRARAPGDAQLAAIDIPVLSVTGHWDDDQLGALTYHERHTRLASPRARDRHFLVIGPWDHTGFLVRPEKVGGLPVAEAGRPDGMVVARDWYDWVLKGKARPAFLKKRVAVYVSGAEDWRYADDRGGIAPKQIAFHLDSDDGRANDPARSGRLLAGAPPAESKPDAWTYDPLDLRPGLLLAADDNPDDELLDQRDALNLYGAAVVYTSEPLGADLDIAGAPALAAWLALDVPDTDFQMSLWEVHPDGSAVRLTVDRRRARYRRSLTEPAPAVPGKVEEYTFRGHHIARRIPKGSRLRLVLGALNSPAYEKNYNDGGVVAKGTARNARTAHVTVFHDVKRPSRLTLPVAIPPTPSRR